METWQMVWRQGIAPHLRDAGLLALRAALAADDKALIQNATTFPPPLKQLENEPAEKVCALGLALRADHGLYTVGDVLDAFAVLVEVVDETLGEPAAIRYWLSWYDSADRDVMRRELLAEVNRTLAGRGILTPAESPAA